MRLRPPANWPLLCAVAVAVRLTWGCSNVMIKGIAVPGLVASFYRLWFSVPLLWAIPLVHAPVAARGSTGNWLRAAAIGGTLFALHQVLFFSALKQTTVANVALIGSLQPPLVLFVARRWFGEPIAPRALPLSLVAVGGAAMVVARRRRHAGMEPVRRRAGRGQPVRVHRLLPHHQAAARPRRRHRVHDRHDQRRGADHARHLRRERPAAARPTPDGSGPRCWRWPCSRVRWGTSWRVGPTRTRPRSRCRSSFSPCRWWRPRGAVVFLGETLGPMQLIGAAVVLVAVAAVVLTQPARTGEELAESVVETDAP